MNTQPTQSSLPRWLAWGREIQALAQTGNHYAVNDYQRQRYHRLIEIAAEIVESINDQNMQRLFQDVP